MLRGGLATFALAALGCSSKSSGGEASAQAPGTAAGGAAQPPAATAGTAAQPVTPPTGTAGTMSAQAGTMATPPVSGAAAPMMGTAGEPSAGMAGGMSNTGGMSPAAGGTGGSSAPTGLDALQCIATPAMTEGPFFVEEELNRSNLLMGETDDAIVNGVPLKLVIGVFEVSGTTCTPLPGVQVDIWHANAIGEYSDVAAGVVQSVDTRGKKYLRGYQLSDEDGVVRFETIYPGWYRSRAIHIHFKLRMLGPNAGAREFVAQMFFDETINTEVLSRPTYSNRSGQRTVLNDDDHIFNGTASNGQLPPPGQTAPGQDIMPELVAEGTGYTATLKIGLQS